LNPLKKSAKKSKSQPKSGNTAIITKCICGPDGPWSRLLRSAPGKDASSGEKEKLIEEGIVSLQFWEMFFTGVPVLVTVIGAIHKHGQRLGKIEAKLDVLYDDVRALEKYN
jgi:hypothetical protein